MSKQVNVKAYPKDFKEQVVKLAQVGDRSATQIAREFEISRESVRRWVKQTELDQGSRTDEWVQAHVLVAALALTFDRILQRKLEKAGLRLSSRAAWEALEAVSLVEFEMPGRPRKAGICVNGEEGGHGNEARKVLRALGVALEAPQHPENGDRIVH